MVSFNSPANAALGPFATCGVTGCVSTPPLSSSTTTNYNTTSRTTTTSTSISYTTSISSSTTTTTTTTRSTFFSYTSTVSTSATATNVSTSYTGTSTSTNTNYLTFFSTATSYTTYTNAITVKGTVFPSCPMALVTTGNDLQPYANFLRNFRNNAIDNTTAGREFLLTFNSWYYSWAPSLSYSAVTNPLIFKTVQLGVYPLIGILYVAYYSYTFIAPFSTEAGAIAAGIVAASLIGAVYVAPVAFVAMRLIKRRLHVSLHTTAPSVLWFVASVLLCIVGYASSSGQLLAFATSSIALSMLSLGGLAGTKALAYVQPPLAGFANSVFAFRRVAKLRF